MATHNLHRLLLEPVVRELVDARTYQRGSEHFLSARVSALDYDGDDDIVEALVRDEPDYDVTLSVDDHGELESDCACPVGINGAFCEHGVAVALAWVNRPGAPKPKTSKVRPAAKEKAPTLAAAAKVLLFEDKEVLIKLLLEWAKNDKQLRERIILHAARRSGPTTAIAAARAAFEKAAYVRGSRGLDYGEVRSWAKGVQDAVDPFEQLFHDGYPAAVVELCEWALAVLANIIEGADDSDGYMGAISDRLEGLHFQACVEARPDPVALAGRLFSWEMRNEFDIFYDAFHRYREVLGPEGIAAYVALAEQLWSQVPAGETGNHPSGYRISRFMKTLAEESGDIDRLVAVIGRDLTSSARYVEIAEAYRKAERDDEALEWAEKGLQAFPVRSDHRLRELVCEEYHRRGRHLDAMNLVWGQFFTLPVLPNFRLLEQQGKITPELWPDWRERALGELRSRIAVAKAKPVGRFGTVPDHSSLVEILLHEGDLEAAWREAKEGGCSKQLWLSLARARENAHPEDAAPLYLALARHAISLVGNGKYEPGVDLLNSAAANMSRLGKSAEFSREMQLLRAQYKAKRNLIKLLDERRLY